LTIDKIHDKLTNANTQNLIRINLPIRSVGAILEVLSGVNLSRFAPFYFIRQKRVGAGLCFSHLRKGVKMARNFNYIYALIEYIENTDGYIYRIFESYLEAAIMQRTLENWKNRYEPERKVTYKIEIYKKGG
jgi:hypothetical protein